MAKERWREEENMTGEENKRVLKNILEDSDVAKLQELHGNIETVEYSMQYGAQINIQDNASDES